MVALFLFCALGGVLDTLADSIKVGSETRLVIAQRDLADLPDAALLPRSHRARCRA